MNCQKCRAPLKLDNSLSDLNPAAYDLLVAASSQQQQPKRMAPSTAKFPQEAERRGLHDKVSRSSGSGASLFKKSGNLHRGDGSFVILTESQVVPPRITGPGNDQQQQQQVQQQKQKQDQAQRQDQQKQQRRRASLNTGTGTGTAIGTPNMRLDGASVTLPHEAERINKLFEIMSARSDIDHPICIECTEMLMDGMQKKLESATRERNLYSEHLKHVQADVPTDEEITAAVKSLAAAREEEKDSMKMLLKLEGEKTALDREMAELEAESHALDGEEEEFWRERNAFAATLSDYQSERDSINCKFEHDSDLLTKLQRANVYNDTFSIHHDGHFATINGLRLGRLSTKPVDWPEINAAWGQALLLLVTVADKLNFKFDGYDTQPMGSTSKIIRIEYPASTSSASVSGTAQHQQRAGPPPAPKRQALDLFSSGDLPLNLLWHRKFDTAMVAFLELVRQLGVFVHDQTRRDPSTSATPLTLPYRIEGDKIGDDRIGHFSIKLGIANDESWTKACKFVLTCCKFLIAHASNVSLGGNGRGSTG